MRELIAGAELEEFCSIAYHANTPFLLTGPPGVGKSEIVRSAAKSEGISVVAINLAVLEPTDFLGLPRIVGDAVIYARPPLLPTDAAGGFLFLDELNRAPNHILSAVYQLLTERAVNGHELPARWLPVAAANIGDEYHGQELDPALVSRFVVMPVRATVESFLAYGRHDGGIHPLILAFAEMSPELFSDARSNPRAWKMASQILHRFTPDGSTIPTGRRELFEKMVAGVVGDAWAASFTRFCVGTQRALDPIAIIEDYATQRPQIRQWVSAKKSDLLHLTLKRLQGHLQAQAVYDAVAAKSRQRLNVVAFAQDLPAELRRKYAAWVDERGFTKLALSRGRA